jgi:TPR repeat protein
MSKSFKIKRAKHRSYKKGGKPLVEYKMPVQIIASFDNEDEEEQLVTLPENTSSVTVKTSNKVDPMTDAKKKFNESIELQIAKEEGIQNNRDNENIWTLRYALQGDSHFQSACGFFYYKGYWSGYIPRDAPSPPQNYNKAFNWFLLAANNFHEHEAQFYLGEMYELGRGTTQNWESALFWYNLSAQNGNQKAIQRLDEYYKQ